MLTFLPQAPERRIHCIAQLRWFERVVICLIAVKRDGTEQLEPIFDGSRMAAWNGTDEPGNETSVMVLTDMGQEGTRCLMYVGPRIV